MELSDRLMRSQLRRRVVRDPSRLAVGAAGAAALVICAVAAAVVWWSLGQLSDEVTARDLDTVTALAGALSRLPPQERAGALPASSEDRVLAVIDTDGSASPADLGAGDDSARWQRWAARVVREAGLQQQFSMRDPSGAQWRYVTAGMPDGATALLGRAEVAQPAIQRAAVRALLAVLLGVGLLGALAWPLVRRGFLRPLDRLIGISEDLRWRGEVRPADSRRLERLARRGDHVGRLARSLVAVDADIGRNFLQLSTLLETTRTVAASLDSSEVFERILRQLQPLFDVERCAVLSLDERAKVFVIRASLGLSEDFVRELRVDPSAPDSPFMRALRSAEPVQVSDTDTDLSYARLRERARREGFRCVLTIPLATAMAPPAVLLLFKSEPYRYSHSELELATSFARFASIAMENAALYARIDERLQEQTRRLEAIIESLDDGLVLAGLDGTVSYHNAAASSMVGAGDRQLTGAQVEKLLGRLGAGPAKPAQDGVVSGPVEVSTTIDGQRRDLRLRSFTVADEHGAALGQGHLWQDITRDRFIDRLKSSLLTTASHELRAPLANIKGYVSTLLASDIEWEVAEQREFLATISAETDRLTALVRNLLDMSRIEAGMLAIRREQVDVGDLVERALAGLPPDERQRVRIDIPKAVGLAALDRARIETAVRNLVDNALKFSTASKPVDVLARRRDGELTIAVRDRGHGVPPELRERIFDSFVRGDDGLAREAGGFGLGLAICRGFVEAHGGRVWTQPERPGASFVIAVPVGHGTSE